MARPNNTQVTIGIICVLIVGCLILFGQTRRQSPVKRNPQPQTRNPVKDVAAIPGSWPEIAAAFKKALAAHDSVQLERLMDTKVTYSTSRAYGWPEEDVYPPQAVSQIGVDGVWEILEGLFAKMDEPYAFNGEEYRIVPRASGEGYDGWQMYFRRTNNSWRLNRISSTVLPQAGREDRYLANIIPRALISDPDAQAVARFCLAHLTAKFDVMVGTSNAYTYYKQSLYGKLPNSIADARWQERIEKDRVRFQSDQGPFLVGNLWLQHYLGLQHRFEIIDVKSAETSFGNVRFQNVFVKVSYPSHRDAPKEQPRRLKEVILAIPVKNGLILATPDRSDQFFTGFVAEIERIPDGDKFWEGLAPDEVERQNRLSASQSYVNRIGEFDAYFEGHDFRRNEPVTIFENGIQLGSSNPPRWYGYLENVRLKGNEMTFVFYNQYREGIPLFNAGNPYQQVYHSIRSSQASALFSTVRKALDDWREKYPEYAVTSQK